MNFRQIIPSFALLGAVSLSLAASGRVSAQSKGKTGNTIRPVTTIVKPITSDTTTSTTAATSPVGFITTTCLSNTDTNLSIPFTRPAAFIGSATGGTQTGSKTGTISFSGTPFTASAYKYVQGTQSTKYYAYVTGGTKEGSIYDITDNTASALTVNTNGDDISTLASGVQVRVIPHWTLGTAFTPGQSIVGTASLGSYTTSVLLPDQTTAGTDLAAASIYYYYSGTSFGGAGWRQVGGAFTYIADDTVLYPESFFVLRNVSGNALTFTPVGTVSTLSSAVTVNGVQTTAVNVATVLNTLAVNTNQDNSVALPVPVDTTLAGSNLYQSGAFTGSSSLGGGVDQLLVYDNTVAGTDKAADRIYYYYTGTTFGGVGWRQIGRPFTEIHDTDVLKAGVGFVVRKQGTSTLQSVVWNYRPIYTP